MVGPAQTLTIPNKTNILDFFLLIKHSLYFLKQENLKFSKVSCHEINLKHLLVFLKVF